MTDGDQQQPLLFPGHRVQVDLLDVERQPTGHSVLTLCATRAGKLDKVVAADLGIQDAVWSRIKSGQNNLSMEQLIRLMRACGNESPLQWMLLRMGYDPNSLRKIESNVERENRELRERLEQLERERQIERKTIRDLLSRGTP